MIFIERLFRETTFVILVPNYIDKASHLTAFLLEVVVPIF